MPPGKKTIGGLHDELKILVVDDRKKNFEKIQSAFAPKNFAILYASDIQKGFRIYRKENPQIILQKIDDLSKEASLKLLKRIKQTDYQATVMMISSRPSLDSVVESLRAGASDYLSEPINLDDLERKILMAFERKNIRRENLVLAELASLHESTLSFYSARSVNDLLPQVLDTCRRVTKADSGSIMFWYATEPHLRIEISSGLRKKYFHNDPQDVQMHVANWVCENARPLIVANGKTLPSTNLPLARNLDTSSMCLPLKTPERIIGVINLSRRAVTEPFTKTDCRIAEVLARQAAIAFKNAKAYEGLKRQVNNLSEIRGFGENIMKFIDRNNVIDFVLSKLLSVFDAEIAALILPSKRRFDLNIASTRKMASGLIESVIDQISGYMSGRISIPRTKVRTIHRVGAISKQTFLQHRIIKNLSFLICPLWNQQEWAGALYIGSSEKNVFDANTMHLLTSIAHQTCAALTSALLYEDLQENHLRTIKALAIAVDAKDKYTRGHSENVMKLAMATTEAMGIVDSKINEIIQNAALLHDIGKIGIPGHILNKPGILSSEEFNSIMKNHVQLGATIIQEIPFLKDLVPLVLHHHERYDGNGYPSGLAGNDIPVGARILTVADSFEAMTSDRPYRKALSREQAVDQLILNKSTQFDPYIVDVFVDMLNKKFPDNKAQNEKVAIS